jgi:hypothetical protein
LKHSDAAFLTSQSLARTSARVGRSDCCAGSASLQSNLEAKLVGSMAKKVQELLELLELLTSGALAAEAPALVDMAERLDFIAR